MTNPNASAYPAAGVQDFEETRPVGGLTKRELLAAMALQGFLANPEIVTWSDCEKDDPSKYKNNIEHYAVKAADALIQALNKEGV